MDLLTWLRAQWDRIAGFGCVAAGGCLLILGWVGASAATRSADEISYLISGGLAGLFLLGIGATLLISADMHDEWRKLDRIEAAILNGEGSPDRGRAPAAEVVPADGAGSGAPAGGVPAGTPAPSPERAGETCAVALVRRGDTGALGLAAVSALLLVFGWVRASGETGPEPSLGGAYLATAGLLLLAVATTGFMLTCRSRCRDRKVRLLASYADRAVAAVHHQEAPDRLPSDQVMVAEGVPLFHRPTCPILAGLAARPLPPSAVPDGLTGCGICGAARGTGGVPQD